MNGKIILITGSSSGIGAETARKFAARGARVPLLARNADRLNHVAKEIKEIGGKADVFPIDVGDWIDSTILAHLLRADLLPVWIK